MIILTFGNKFPPAFQSVSRFHNSSVLLSMPNHKLFSRIDWDKVEAGSYAVVDPVNPGNILYLTEQDYVVMVRVALTSNRTLKVLAQPGDSPSSFSSSEPSTSNQNTPRSSKELLGHPWLSALFVKGSKKQSKARKQVRYLFHSPFAQASWREKGNDLSMIKIHKGNFMNWLRIWSNKLHFMARGSIATGVNERDRRIFGQQLLVTLVAEAPVTLYPKPDPRSGISPF